MFSVIIPVYSSNNNLKKKIDKINSLFEKKEIINEILVILDGSNYTPRYKITNTSFIRLKINTGKGNAIRKGIKYSKFDNLIFIDDDLPFFDYLNKMIDSYLENKADALILHRNGNKPKFRKILSYIFNKIVKFLISWDITDTQAGLKIFNKNKIPDYKTNGYLFDVEILRDIYAGNGKIISLNCQDNFQNYKNSSLMKPRKLYGIFKDFIKIFFFK